MTALSLAPAPVAQRPTREHTITGGGALTVPMAAGQRLLLRAEAPSAAAAMLVFAAGQTRERLSVPDTLKAQMSWQVSAPMVLMSDRGRSLLSVLASSAPGHDAVSGHSLDADVAQRFGPSSYAAHGHDERRSSRRGLLDEVAKLGADERALHPTVNWFCRLTVSDADQRAAVGWDGGCVAGEWVYLRADVAVDVVLATAPHPYDPRPAWDPAPVTVRLEQAGPLATDDDPSMRFRPETARALALSRWGV